MKIYITALLSLLYLNGCLESPDPSSINESDIQYKIESNHQEAEKAKEEYRKLQLKRNN